MWPEEEDWLDFWDDYFPYKKDVAESRPEPKETDEPKQIFYDPSFEYGPWENKK